MFTDTAIARIVGVLFLIALLTYGFGFGLIETLLTTERYFEAIATNKAAFVSGAILMLLNSAAIVGIGIMMFPLLKRHNIEIAVGYFSTRVIESTLLIVGIVFLLLLLTVSQAFTDAGAQEAELYDALGALAIRGNYFAFQIAMMVLGTGSLAFCYLLFITRLVPRLLSVLGFVGYLALLVGAVMEVYGFNVGGLSYIPGGLFEVLLPLWLIVKGFNTTQEA